MHKRKLPKYQASLIGNSKEEGSTHSTDQFSRQRDCNWLFCVSPNVKIEEQVLSFGLVQGTLTKCKTEQFTNGEFSTFTTSLRKSKDKNSKDKGIQDLSGILFSPTFVLNL